MKTRVLFFSLLWLSLPLLSAIAHHSYGEYDRDKQVTLEGAVKDVLWANPHVRITLQTEEHGEYLIEWNAVTQLSRQGVDAAVIKSGDRLSVTGSLNRNPEKRILTLVRAVQRSSDGWNWGDPRYIPNK